MVCFSMLTHGMKDAAKGSKGVEGGRKLRAI